MTAVAVAASSQIAAEAAVEVARAGGNAVDAAIASSLVQLVTEPGVVSLAAGALIVIWPPDGAPVMVDGAAEMPGRTASRDQLGQGGIDVMLPYGGGTPSTVGYASIATPGAVAGYDLAARRWGKVPWKLLVEPAHRHVRDGFPMPVASEAYLAGTGQGIFGWNPGSLGPLLDQRGDVKKAGDLVRIDGLDGSLAEIAEHGAATFYKGDLARTIANDCQAHGGVLDLVDLEAYEARETAALEATLDDWHVATAPLPSVGGATLAAMLLSLRGLPHEDWTREVVRQLIAVQQRVGEYRRDRLDKSARLDADVEALLESAAAHPSGFASPSTVHTSVVDASGLACAITASAGYGSGVMPPGTGIFMNNCLGEAELNKRGFHALSPGTRLPSNMAPTTGRRADGTVLAIGSPGADRITSAILCTLTGFVHLGMPLHEAVNHPRLHVEWPNETGWRVAFEPGLPVNRLDVPQRAFDDLDMYFGGVGAVSFTPPAHFETAADKRRTGGTAVSE